MSSDDLTFHLFIGVMNSSSLGGGNLLILFYCGTLGIKLVHLSDFNLKTGFLYRPIFPAAAG